jgi:hypothetical protein
MVEALRRDYSLTTMKIRERIATAVLVRLRQKTPHREAVRRAMAIYAMPWNKIAELKTIYATVDAMWRAAGDRATDFNHYTKRGLLYLVYGATLAFWLQEVINAVSGNLDRRGEVGLAVERLDAQVIGRALDQAVPGCAGEGLLGERAPTGFIGAGEIGREGCGLGRHGCDMSRAPPAPSSAATAPLGRSGERTGIGRRRRVGFRAEQGQLVIPRKGGAR